MITMMSKNIIYFYAYAHFDEPCVNQQQQQRHEFYKAEQYKKGKNTNIR